MREVAAANLIDRKSEVHLLNSKAVDGPEVIAHGDNIIGKAVGFQIVEHLQHGLIEAFAMSSRLRRTKC